MMSETRLRVLLLNALVLPGSGHVYVKQIKTGIALAIPSLLLAAYLVVKFFLFIYSFFSGATADLMKIATLYAQLWDDASFKYSLILLAVIWVGSVADSFRITNSQ